MSGYLGKTNNRDREVVREQAQAEREDQWGSMPGEIVDYDAATGTATVRPLFKKRRYDGTDLQLPDLVEVPVDFPRTGSAGLTFPIPAGTRVQLTPQMRSMERYDTEDDGAYADDFAGSRSFNLSDMRASVTGGNSLSDPMKGVDPDNTHLRFDDGGQYGIRGSNDGKIAIEGNQGNIYDLIATFMELVAADGLNIKTGSSVGVGIHELENRAQLLDIAAKIRGMAL